MEKLEATTETEEAFPNSLKCHSQQFVCAATTIWAKRASQVAGKHRYKRDRRLSMLIVVISQVAHKSEFTVQLPIDTSS